ncbi:MAG TPA: hypothetical protein DER07_10350 [Armatimonadetes bacterium]|nr:hypothetical protein [Armatimonadota bacterium]HCE01430.1 hypothetical protein [Armatimonadota bacterium]
MVSLDPRLKLGVEFNPVVREALPIANWIALEETARQPMLTFGTSSDRIFSPEGYRSYYATVAKSLPGGRFAPYVGVSYSEWEETLLFPFGANIQFAREWDLLPMYDGRNTHLLLTYKRPQWNLTLMLVKMERFGVSLGFGF